MKTVCPSSRLIEIGFGWQKLRWSEYYYIYSFASDD